MDHLRCPELRERSPMKLKAALTHQRAQQTTSRHVGLLSAGGKVDVYIQHIL